MNCSYKTYSYLYSPTTYTERHIPSSSTNSTLRYTSFLLYHTTTYSLLFNNNCSSHLLNVLVITISLIFKSLFTWNLVWPCTVNGELSGSIPWDFPENDPSSYQCAYTQLLFLPRPHVGLCIVLLCIVCITLRYMIWYDNDMQWECKCCGGRWYWLV